MMTSRDISSYAAGKIIELVHHNNASHVGGALSVVDVLSVLYGGVMSYQSADPGWTERDRLFYSKGHACTALYAVLSAAGFFPEAELDGFTKNGSYFTSHVNNRIPGVELSTGSLGHALSVACGVALAGKRADKSWKVYTVVSDGELNEGSNWEAILFAPHHQLSNLSLIVDYNKIQSFGTVKEVLDLDPLTDKFKAFGWEVFDIDGHSHNEIHTALTTPCAKPKCIIANTIKGKGVPFMENSLAWHYKTPNAEQMSEAIQALKNKAL